MKLLNKIILLTLLMLPGMLHAGNRSGANSTANGPVLRAEPLNWWLGMNTPLQIMFHGPEISEYEVTVKEKGVSVAATHKADSPNYLFVDIVIGSDAKAGDYTFEFRNGKKRFSHSYSILQREAGSAQRGSFGPEDMIYLIMPDRFANGDPSNDDTPCTAEKSDRTKPFGRHGGDLKGMIKHLDYIEQLGATAVWSTPLLLDDEPAASYHGYACADYYRIDPRYGDNDLFREFVGEAHEKGLKIIMDVVTNHCGTAHWWMDDLPFNDWIHPYVNGIKSNGALSTGSDPNVSKVDLEGCVERWFDDSMPDMALENPFVLQYFKQVFVWWIEWAGLDGLRVDTYPYNDKQAMAEWVASILNEYPNLNIVGECWTGSPAMVAYWDGKANNRDGFNSNLPSVMDFPLQEAICSALDAKKQGWDNGTMKIYNAIAHDFLYGDPNSLMIFLDNHDTDRFADVVRGDLKKMKLGITLLATLRGVPQLYYGTELMLRSSDMKQGHGGARVDFPGGWPGDTLNLFNAAQRTKKQQEIFTHTSRLFNWRKECKTIHNGKTMHFLDRNNLYAYFRYDDENIILVLVNASAEAKKVNWERYSEILAGAPASGEEILTGKTTDRNAPLAIPAMESMVIQFKLK